MELYEKNGNILYILNVLKKYSDEEHILRISDIKEKIRQIYNIEIDSRTIRRNINLLIEKFDYDISTWSENKKGYFILRDPDTDFELGELRTIIDTFSYAPFIDSDTSKKIVNKCKNMQNIYEKIKLNEYKVYSDYIKTNNKEVLLNIEEVSNAIYNKNKMQFDYYKYELKNNLQFNKIDTCIISPYAIVYSIQEMYLVALKNGENKLFTYRIDRMKNIKVLKEKVSSKIRDEDIEECINSMIYMYGSHGEDIEVICDNVILDNVIEVFGKNIYLKQYDETHFVLKINKDIESFKRYVLRNLDYIKIIKPIKLKENIKNIVKEWLKND